MFAAIKSGAVFSHSYVFGIEVFLLPELILFLGCFIVYPTVKFFQFWR